MSLLTVFQQLSTTQRAVVLVCAIAVAVAMAWPNDEEAVPVAATESRPSTAVHSRADAASPVVPPPTPATLSHEVVPGDTLGGLFTQHGLGLATLHHVLEADQELLALDILRPGNQLHFEWTEDRSRLDTLSLVIHPGRTIHYRRLSDDAFEAVEDNHPGHWHERVLISPIEGSFYASASQAGLNDADIVKAERIFRERVNFRRDIRVGDRFEIVLSEERVRKAEPTGQTRIEAIRLRLGKRMESAFLHDDGSYYDARGESLGRAFLRQPMQGPPRVSSHFNPRRLHPVTKRIAPHNGVDFAMPVGTPILSIADGVITRIGNHPYAGKYLEVEHPGQFKTRYLHLSRISVRQGQNVRRGQQIALSGNTGRSTGPHLHFELHVNNRPVDPLKADIPRAKRIPAREMVAFDNKVRTLLDTLEHAELRLAQRNATHGNEI
ncbi:peptidoglycan DD-metalloendopeptidase family protein [Stutzerimonas nitrititolerans]|uniref:peptidoglycan DD-metalloendopeptidase family protein n=1 Tax=Stutzerimonas nitrititolerans TaxID=2482751 RepID=UPI00269B084C|nr:peptidoglycan DD-metalloendopeptidase family protein [Stutzerimonas nitrititolerans]